MLSHLLLVEIWDYNLVLEIGKYDARLKLRKLMQELLQSSGIDYSCKLWQGLVESIMPFSWKRNSVQQKLVLRQFSFCLCNSKPITRKLIGVISLILIHIVKLMD